MQVYIFLLQQLENTDFTSNLKLECMLHSPEVPFLVMLESHELLDSSFYHFEFILDE